ncbi:D-xylulose reductase [Purpureocillium takamizusanense]|uniref:L-arabinitol 4-dehydrogenase n=1 Tax=Purpureocillium takamizusanense TaxID=2060973 RepID=A0A9Q8QMD6_9HYPO|nr:D-xylulose reductase [Purpureocillium takamizusanense]UNI23829.1 D-xylulose reductase [Purpureocillium takamizusanense]
MKMTNPSFVLRAVKDVALEDRPTPQLKDPNDVLVHVGQTGICGSDVHYWQRGRIGSYILTAPMVLGHESAGTVVQVGRDVTTLRPGDKVAMEPGVPCRRCDQCRRGTYHLCGQMVFAATPPYDGTLAKYYINAADFCYKIPDSMDLEQAAMVEPLSVAVAVAKTADLRAHQTVVVLGCGPIGVLCQAVAKSWGAKKVIGVDVVDSRLQVAKSYGVDGVFKPRQAEDATVDPMQHAEDVAEELKAAFDLGEGADAVLECSGAESCVQMGIYAAKHGGTFVQAGMGKEVVSFPITTVCIRGLTIKGSIRYLAGCYPAAIDLISSGKVDVKRLVTNRFKFEDAEKAFELVKEGRSDVFKVLIEGVQ